MAQNMAETQSVPAEGKAVAAPHVDEQAIATQATLPAFKILKSNPVQQPTSSLGDCTPTPVQSDVSMATPDAVSCVTTSLEGLEVADDVNGAEDSALDEFLVNALKNRQDRIFLLKLDRELCSFINNPNQEQLEFPSMNSYYRMVIHRVANYFKITRMVDPMQKTIVLYKTEQSAIPALRFSDLVEEEEEQPVKPMKLLKRNPGRPSSGVSTPDGSSESDRRPLSIKEREEAYAKARARIFQEDVPSKPKSPGESSAANSQSDSPLALTDPLEPSRQDVEDDSKANKGRKQSNGKKTGGAARSPDELCDVDLRQYNSSTPSSRDISRSSSPSPPAVSLGSEGSAKMAGKGLGPKSKLSKSDLALECADNRRRKSTTSSASSSSGTTRTAVGLARTISSSSSQDGFHSPALGGALSESPTVNSPANSVGKGYDYFAHNPSPNAGSVSPMSTGSSRNSYTYPQSGHKQQHRNHTTGNNGGSPNNGNHNHNQNVHSSSTSFAKVMNAPVFVPKRGFPKHGQATVYQNHNHNHSHGFSNGPMPAYHSSSNQPHNNYIKNGAAHSYTPQQHPNTSMPWQDRGMPPSHESTAFFGAPQDVSPPVGSQAQPSQGFSFSNSLGQPYHQNGQNIPSFNNNVSISSSNHHPASYNNPHGFQQSSYRGGRRSQSTHSHYGHQSHYHHPHHSRTHPQVHHPQHQSSNFSGPPLKDELAYPQHSQPNRHSRTVEGHHGHIPHQPYGQDFFPTQGPGPAGDAQQHELGHHGGFPGQQLQTSPGDNTPNGPRFPYSQRGVYDWNQGQQSVSSQGPDPSVMLYNLSSQSPVGGKKPYKGYQPTQSMSQQPFSPMMGSQQGVMAGQPSSLFGPGSGNMSNSGVGQLQQQQQQQQAMYDVERRPPKSAELFDPNGCQTSSGIGGGGGSDAGFVPFEHHQQIIMSGVGPTFQPLQPSQFGNHYSPQPQTAYPSLHQPAHQHQQHPNQYQQQQHQHQYQHQTPLTQTHTPVAMNRSYSSSSSGGYGGGHNSSSSNTGVQHLAGKKNNLLYDYSVAATPYDGVSKHSPTESEKMAPSLSHILEIYDFDAQDDIFKDLVLPTGSKLRRLKPSSSSSSSSSKDAAAAMGQCLVVFKNAALASDALLAFQEGRETWMGPEASLGSCDRAMAFKNDIELSAGTDTDANVEADAGAGESEGEYSGSTTTAKRLQWRFNIKIWTPVLVNSTVAYTVGAVVGGSFGPAKSSSLLTTATTLITTPSLNDPNGCNGVTPPGREGTCSGERGDGEDKDNTDEDQDSSSASSSSSSTSSLSVAKESQQNSNSEG
ncbi:R3H domain-containing protein 1 [Mortierella sp. GBA30]|nr:R3H domain-containing protein 1 [Mortierella sp. GBA30]